MRPRGELKRLVLESLGDGRWHYPREISGVLPFGRRSQLHAYLLRLCEDALVERTLDRRGVRYAYRLTERGCRLLLAQHWQERQRIAYAPPLPVSASAANRG
jgi:DNA-binding HxlR family transcriptional regulator